MTFLLVCRYPVNSHDNLSMNVDMNWAYECSTASYCLWPRLQCLSTLCLRFDYGSQTEKNRMIDMKHVYDDRFGRIAQLVTCLATHAFLTADPSLILAWSHTFVEIDMKMFEIG